MSEEELPPSFDGGFRVWLGSIAFTLVLKGGDLMAEQGHNARFWLGLSLVIIALPITLSAAWWRLIKEKLAPSLRNKFKSFLSNPNILLGSLAVLTVMFNLDSGFRLVSSLFHKNAILTALVPTQTQIALPLPTPTKNLPLTLAPLASPKIDQPDTQLSTVSLSASSLKPKNIPTSLEVQINTTDQPPMYVTDKNIYAWTFLPVQIYKQTTCPPPLSIGTNFSNPIAFPSTNLFSPNASSSSMPLLSGLPFSNQNGDLSKQSSFPLNFSTSSASSSLNSQECDTAVKQWIFFLMFQRPILYKNLTFDAHGAALPNIDIQETDPYYAEFLVQGSLPTMVLDIGTTN